MTRDVPDDIEWLEPWVPLTDSGDSLVRELQSELSDGHILHGITVAAVARRGDCDDVLFATADPSKPLAVVHLTWKNKPETNPQWPYTTTYGSWQEWTERCLIPDHDEFNDTD
jgi:hypothetical protein